jgi:hypothetical protein
MLLPPFAVTAGAIAIAPVEDLPFVDNHRLVNAVLPDVSRCMKLTRLYRRLVGMLHII